MAAPGTPAHVLVPVKAFHEAKVRLSPVLDDAARALLARLMADVVLAAAAPLPAAVVCDDQAVADWASAAGAEVLWTPGRGLNGAVEDGVAHLAAAGARRVVVAHADLPLAADLASVAEGEGVILVPDRRDDGTNVLSIPADAGFGFAYGPGSCARHAAEGRRLGLEVEVRRDDRLAWDVDVPDDLVHPEVERLVRAGQQAGDE
jgi:2-phospho-L-lactate/phosphoenolpyruvate guanylyltransferase